MYWNIFFLCKLASLYLIVGLSLIAIYQPACLQQLFVSITLKCVMRFLQWRKLSNKEFVLDLAFVTKFLVSKRWNCYKKSMVSRASQKRKRSNDMWHSKS